MISTDRWAKERRRGAPVPGSGQMPYQAPAGAYLVTRVPGTAHPCQAGRRGVPGTILSAAGDGALPELIRAGSLGRPVSWTAAP
jgi:hypothetical protein